MEEVAALNSGQVVLAGFDGEIVEVDARKIVLKAKDGKGKEAIKEYKLNKFKRSNQFTCISQRPIVVKGQKVKEGEGELGFSAFRDDFFCNISWYFFITSEFHGVSGATLGDGA
jgi:hypothetical protein